MIRFKLSHALPALALALVVPAAASADDIDNLLNGAPAAAEAAQDPALAEGELGAIEGAGVDVDNSINGSVVSMQELNAANSDNTIGGDVLSGDVSFSDHALQGFSGIGNFAINTGAQSNIQSSISISVMTVAP